MPEEDATVFPKQADRNRITKYEHFDRIYFGNHYEAYAVKGDKEFSQRYQKLRYIVANFGGLMSRVMADTLFGETPTFDYKDKRNQKWSDGFFDDNQFLTQLFESELVNSRSGDDVFKLRIGQRNPSLIGSAATVIVEEVTPAIYFPELTRTATRNTPTTDVIAEIFDKDGKCYLHKETHLPGSITHEVYLYDKNARKVNAEQNPEDFGYPRQEDTGVDRSLVFHIPNVRDGSGFWGTSDYNDLDSLFFALNNRMTKVDNILDKHSDPMLAVPTGFLDDKGKVRKEHLGIYEVDSENPGFNKPEYVIWDAELAAAFKEVDKLIDLLFMFSEIAPATMGMDKDGMRVESGRALKFKLLATIRKKKRKQRYYDQAIKDILETAQQLGYQHGIQMDGVAISTPERPSIKWSDGVINDEIEDTDLAAQRISDGTLSRADAIARLDNVSPEEAKKKLAEIDKESGPDLTALTGGGVLPKRNKNTGQPDPNTPPVQQGNTPAPPKDRGPVSNRI